MNILVINAGSSSLKYQLIRMEDETILCKGVCERIGIDGKYSYKTADGYKVEKTADLFTHKDAFDVILHEMVEGEGRVIHSVEEIAAVGHRVTHGGDKFSRSVLIDEATIEAINARPAEDLFYRLRNARLNYYRSLSAWKHFGKGWTNRVMDLKFVG